MSVPNNSIATAIVIASLPWSLTLDTDLIAPDDGAWYAYTTTACDVLLSVRVANSGGNFPGAQFFAADGVTPLAGDLEADRLDPVQQAVDPSTLYYIKVIPSGSPSPVVTVTVDTAPGSVIPAGSLIVPDDTLPWPAVAIDPTTGAVIRAIAYPTGENADILPNGISCTVHENPDNYIASIDLFDANFALITANATLAALMNHGTVQISGDRVSRFYLAQQVLGLAGSPTLRTLNDDGTVGPTYTLPGADQSLACLAVNTGGTILYWSAGGNGSVIQRYDITNSVALSNLATLPAGYHVQDLIVLTDGTILAGLRKSGVGADDIVRLYSAAGATLHDYPARDATYLFDHIARAADDPNSFWLWQEKIGGAKDDGNRFTNLKISDGSTLGTPILLDIFEGGFGETPTTGPFGVSASCPFFVTTQEIPACSVEECDGTVIVGEPVDQVVAAGEVTVCVTVANPSGSPFCQIAYDGPDVPVGAILTGCGTTTVCASWPLVTHSFSFHFVFTVECPGGDVVTTSRVVAITLGITAPPKVECWDGGPVTALGCLDGAASATGCWSGNAQPTITPLSPCAPTAAECWDAADPDAATVSLVDCEDQP